MIVTTEGMGGQFGELQISDENGRMTSYPTYTCGHCTRIVAMNPGRLRDRKKCLYCMRMICDSEICDPSVAGCTPIYSISDGHYELEGNLKKKVEGIMQGATTLKEVEQITGGLIG